MFLQLHLSYSSISKNILYLYQKFLKNFFFKYKINATFINLPCKKKIQTFLKSPHVNKRAKENFQFTIYKFKIYLFLHNSFIKLFRYNVPKNIHLKMLYTK